MEARSGGGVLWGGCVGAHTPGETWGCGDSNPVPARGGESTYRILITASYGHQKTALTLTGFTFRLVAYARDNTRFDDPTPERLDDPGHQAGRRWRSGPVGVGLAKTMLSSTTPRRFMRRQSRR